LGPVSAQEIRYRVREYHMPIPLVIPGTPQPAAEPTASPAPEASKATTEGDADAQQTEGDADAQQAATSPEAAPAAEAEPAAAEAPAAAEQPEGDPAATVEVTQPVVTLAEVLAQGDYHLVEAIVQAEALQSALMSPLNDESLWRILRDQAIDQPRDSMRTGVVLAIDSTLAIKRLPADLSEHLVQAVGQMATRRDATCEGEDASPAVLRRAMINLLAEELEHESPDWALVHRLLTTIDKFDQPLGAADAPAGAAGVVDSSRDAEAPSPQP
jgi:hypothetical protein